MAEWKGCLPQGNPHVFAPICLRLPLLLDLIGVCSPINFKRLTSMLCLQQLLFLL